MDDRGPALIINDGSIGGLIACWAEGVVRPNTARSTGKPSRAPVAWFAPDDRPARDRRRDAVRRQVELCSLGSFSEHCPIRLEPTSGLPALSEGLYKGASQNVMLLGACIEAASLGLSRVIWPIRTGTGREADIDQLATICDRALLVAQLVGLDAPSASALRIETPYADLTDAQMMDLALDIDAPLHAAWWCLNEGDLPCGHCSACMRWREALAAVDPAGRLDIQILATSPTHGAAAIGPLKQT